MKQTDIEDFLIVDESGIIKIEKEQPKEKQEIDPNFPEGLYFGMSEEQYHKLPYFSRSFAENIIFDLEEAYYSLKNSIEPSKAMIFGTAAHAVLLEPEKFKETYVKIPSKDEYDGKQILDTCKDLREFLTEIGEKKGGNKPELIARARNYANPDRVIIWDDLIANFMADAELQNKKILDNKNYDDLIGVVNSFNKAGQIKEIINGGKSEVTIIWKDEETDLMCKCRLDYARPEAIGEVKTFSVKNQATSLMHVIFKEIYYNGYNFQFMVYREALEIIIKKIKAGKAKVFGEVEQEWLDRFLENSKKEFFFLFIRSQAPYQIKAIKMVKSEISYDGETPQEYYKAALENWRYALGKYSRALKSGIWAEKELETLNDVHVPQIAYQSIMY